MLPPTHPTSSLTSTQQILQHLFITTQSPSHPKPSSSHPHPTLKKQLRINLKLLKKISEQNDSYKPALELVLVLERVLYTGKQRLSLRELVYKTSAVFRNGNGSERTFSFSGSGFSSPKKQKLSINEPKLSTESPQKEQQPSQEHSDQQQVTSQSNNSTSEDPHIFVSDQLNKEQKNALIQCLTKIRSNLSHTIYESRITQLITWLTQNNSNNSRDDMSSNNKNNNSKNINTQQNGDNTPSNSNTTRFSQQDTYKKLLAVNNLGLDGNKPNRVQEFLSKGYQSIDGKFGSFQALYSFMAIQILPLIQRKILSISIHHHTQRQTFLTRAITFLSQFYLHQFILQIKINKATLIENRIFVEKLYRENFRRHQALLLNDSLTNVVNQALLCPSNMAIQVPLFRMLKRMYYLWGGMGTSSGSAQFIDIKSQEDNLGQFIKYPLMVNLKNISLYCKPTQNDEQTKQPAMFCYRTVKANQDLFLANQIQTLSQMRFIKESKYYSSKAYAFSEEISKIYDTFDLRMGLWKYYKRVERGEVWGYNVLVERPNSLLIWEFYLQGYDIGFGIYKVQGFKKHSIEQYTKQKDCKQILKIDKCTVTQTQPNKGFLFLKNGLYRLVFDNSYSKLRGKDLSYMVLQLESEG